MTQAKFVISAPGVAELSIDELPEVAVVGRSNVGKSTLINRLCGQKSLAKTSGTPGRTQLLNVFEVTRNSEKLHLIDLPGYGYAKISKDKRMALHEIILDYVTERDELNAILLLHEARRKIGEEEQVIQQIAFERGLPLIIVLTKCDKLNQKERSKSLKERSQEFNLLPDDLVQAGEKQRTDLLWERISLAIQ